MVRPLPNDARLWPAGTLYSSVNEMARFVTALMNDGKVDGKPVLPSGIATRMRTVGVAIPATNQEYGHGRFISRGRVEVGHGGTMTGYAAQLSIADSHAMDPSSQPRPRLGVVVLTNGDGVNRGRLVELGMTIANAEGTRRTGDGAVIFSGSSGNRVGDVKG